MGSARMFHPSVNTIGRSQAFSAMRLRRSSTSALDRCSVTERTGKPPFNILAGVFTSSNLAQYSRCSVLCAVELVIAFFNWEYSQTL